MNNLQDLNAFTGETITFDDERTPGFVFSMDSAKNQSLTINEGQTHIVPIGIDVEEVINYDQMTSTYTINLTSATNFTASWPTVPSYMTVTNPSTGIYIISGFRSAADWDIVKRPTITPPPSYFGTTSYTASIGWSYGTTSGSKSWTVNLTVNEVDSLTYGDYFYWEISTSQTIQNNPVIQDASQVGVTYELIITPSSTSSISDFYTNGMGGTSTTDSGTFVTTITGSKEEINSHLENIIFVSNSTISQFNLSFYIVNINSGESDLKTQTVICSLIRYLALPTSANVNYNEDSYTTLSGCPLITDIASDGTGTYILRITGSGVRTLSATGTGGSASFNSSNSTLTIVGTRTQVNSYMSNIILLPDADLNSDFTLTYTLTTPTAATQAKSQLMVFGNPDVEVTGLAVQRYYAKNTATFIFGNTTYINTSSNSATLSQASVTITDSDPIAATYTLRLEAEYGTFSSDNATASSVWTYTGSRSQCNAALAALRYYAPKTFTIDIDINYTQTKGGVTQADIDFTLQSVDTGSTTYARDFVVTATGSWKLPYDTWLYSGRSADIMVMGGGGAGGHLGGGGGGGRKMLSSYTLTNAGYSISIGVGGTPVATAQPYTTTESAIVRGKSTTAFGQTAVGGEGGSRYGGGKGGSVPENTSGWSNGASYIHVSGQYENANNGGGGGGGANSTNIGEAKASGYSAAYNSQYGTQGGQGGAGFEFPTNSGRWYGGGGGGSGGQALYAINPPTQYNINGAGGYYDPDVYPITNDSWAGGGFARSVSSNPAIPLGLVTTGTANGFKGGGGGGTNDVWAANAGTGGSGVVVIRVTN